MAIPALLCSLLRPFISLFWTAVLGYVVLDATGFRDAYRHYFDAYHDYCQYGYSLNAELRRIIESYSALHPTEDLRAHIPATHYPLCAPFYLLTVPRRETVLSHLRLDGLSWTDRPDDWLSAGLGLVVRLGDSLLALYLRYTRLWALALLSLAVLTACVLLLCSVRVRHVRVSNRFRGFDVSFLRQDFTTAFAKHRPPRSLPDSHSNLAHQRRWLESWCLEHLLSLFTRVRDVGGSRTRFPHLAQRKHICSPILDASDVFRDSKADALFENCGGRGEDCPSRFDIPAAMLSHVDYHLTREQLTRIVTGPTFVITHDFRDGDNPLGCSPDADPDCIARCRDGLVTMEPRAGTPYGPHPYHLWQSEGCVVSKYGAFTYVRIGTYGETSVYYCHPSAGTYSTSDPGNLRRSTEGAGSFRGKLTNRVLHYTPSADGYILGVDDIPRSVVDYVAMTFARVKRDDKYFDCIRAYYQNRARAVGFEPSDPKACFDFILHKADEYTNDSYNHSSIVAGVTPSFIGHLVNRAVLRFEHLLPVVVFRSIASFTYRLSTSKHLPWTWQTIHLPTYDVAHRALRVRLWGKNPSCFNFDRFRTEATIARAPDHGQSAPGASQDRQQHGDVTRDARVEQPSTSTSQPCQPSPCPPLSFPRHQRADAAPPAPCTPSDISDRGDDEGITRATCYRLEASSSTDTPADFSSVSDLSHNCERVRPSSPSSTCSRHSRSPSILSDLGLDEPGRPHSSNNYVARTDDTTLIVHEHGSCQCSSAGVPSGPSVESMHTTHPGPAHALHCTTSEGTCITVQLSVHDISRLHELCPSGEISHALFVANAFVRSRPRAFRHTVLTSLLLSVRGYLRHPDGPQPSSDLDGCLLVVPPGWRSRSHTTFAVGRLALAIPKEKARRHAEICRRGSFEWSRTIGVLYRKELSQN
uniref:Chroparavirus methyltransferase domain-containing protein n=1 Tax=Xiangshan sinhali-like virus TaxID=2886238 RepID=A0A8K1YQM2_9VIRU|nr:MAG: hypothetical protein [Xiangshan sinhali-like virus]